MKRPLRQGSQYRASASSQPTAHVRSRGWFSLARETIAAPTDGISSTTIFNCVPAFAGVACGVRASFLRSAARDRRDPPSFGGREHGRLPFIATTQWQQYD
jgi:hypothetical protein